MSIRHINKALKRIHATRSEYAEYSNRWHMKGGWCAYEKRMHSRALRVWARAVVRDELEQMDPGYVVQTPAGRKRPETKRRNKERSNAWWAFWEVRRLQEGLGPWFEPPDHTRVSAWRRARQEAYERLCDARRNRYWRRFLC